MRSLMRFRQWLPVIILVAAGGCASTPEPLEVLDKTWNNYEKAMIWGEYSYCISAHKGNKISALQQQRLKSIKVTGYEVVDKKITADMTAATQTVEIKYYNKAYAVVRSMIVDQEWAFDAKSNQWVILTPFPEFK